MNSNDVTSLYLEQCAVCCMQNIESELSANLGNDHLNISFGVQNIIFDLNPRQIF